MSLMTSQALGKIDFNRTDFYINETNSTDIQNEILNEKIGIVTTLAFFVGLIQVKQFSSYLNSIRIYFIQIILSIFRLGFVTTYLTEPFVSGFTTGAAIHVFSSQIATIFGVKSPSNLPTIFKLPRFYIEVIKLIFTKINWVTSGISLSSIVFLYTMKYFNNRYKSKIRLTIPVELILVS